VNLVYFKVSVDVEQVERVEQAGEDERFDRQLLLPFPFPRDRSPCLALSAARFLLGNTPVCRLIYFFQGLIIARASVGVACVD